MLKARVNKATILLAGGHAGTTAFALTQKIREEKKDVEIHFVGVDKAVEGFGHDTLEKRILPKQNVYFHSIFMGRIQRVFTLWTIPALFKIPVGFVHAFVILLKVKPIVLVSFGGFASYPVVFWAWFLGIPIIIHEQTAAVGRANKYASFFADKIALARESSSKYFPRNKCVVVGNPISEGILKIKKKHILSNPACILITGGSRGSVPINEVVDEILPLLLSQFRVIHQTGKIQFDKHQKIRSRLSPDMQERYQVLDVGEGDVWYKLFEEADIVISRAGANTVSEIMCMKRPTLFIPLPFAYEEEQLKNALFAEDFGVAHILEQKKLNAKTLVDAIDKLFVDWERMVRSIENKTPPDLEAAKRLSELVLKTVDENIKK